MPAALKQVTLNYLYANRYASNLNFCNRKNAWNRKRELETVTVHFLRRNRTEQVRSDVVYEMTSGGQRINV